MRHPSRVPGPWSSSHLPVTSCLKRGALRIRISKVAPTHGCVSARVLVFNFSLTEHSGRKLSAKQRHCAQIRLQTRTMASGGTSSATSCVEMGSRFCTAKDIRVEVENRFLKKTVILRYTSIYLFSLWILAA